MFKYEDFKKNMVARGHKVTKSGSYITINPNNNYIEYAKGFASAEEVIEGYESDLKFVSWEHFNTHIYWVRFKIDIGYRN